MSPFDTISGSDDAVTVVVSVYSLIIYKRYVTRSNQPLSHPFE